MTIYTKGSQEIDTDRLRGIELFFDMTPKELLALAKALEVVFPDAVLFVGGPGVTDRKLKAAGFQIYAAACPCDDDSP